jgi:hypothetical protein
MWGFGKEVRKYSRENYCDQPDVTFKKISKSHKFVTFDE